MFKISTFVLTVALVYSQYAAAEKDEIDMCREKATKIIDKRIDASRPKLAACESKNDCTFISVGTGLHINKKFYQTNHACMDNVNTNADKICRFGWIKKGGQLGGGLGVTWDPTRVPTDYDCLNKTCTPTYDSKSTRKFSFPDYSEATSNLDKRCREEFDQYLIENLTKK